MNFVNCLTAANSNVASLLSAKALDYLFTVLRTFTR